MYGISRSRRQDDFCNRRRGEHDAYDKNYNLSTVTNACGKTTAYSYTATTYVKA